MSVEAGQGSTNTYHIQEEGIEITAPFEPKKHYLRVDAVSWFVNKENNFWKSFIASGAIQLKLVDENYEIGLGTYELQAGMKTAPIFNRPVISDRVYLGGGLTINILTQAIKRDRLFAKILKDLGNSTIEVVTGAIQGATIAGPAASLLEVSKSLTNNIKEILNQGEKKIDLFHIEDSFQLRKLHGDENFILFHRGSKLNKDKLKITYTGHHKVNLTYNGAFLDDGAWVLLRISRIDKYSGKRPWYDKARSAKAEIDTFMDTFELGMITQEKAITQLTHSDNDPNNIASKILEVISIIRNDFVLSYRDALVESSMFKNMLLAARKAVMANDASEYIKARDNFFTETKSVIKPDTLTASILKSENKSLSFRDKLLNIKTNSMKGNDLLRSVRYTSPVSLV